MKLLSMLFYGVIAIIVTTIAVYFHTKYFRLINVNEDRRSMKLEVIVNSNNIECNDIVWCSIAMPTKSYFRFDNPPDDVNRWKLACSQAASGEQVLMKKIRGHFTNQFDFLDGDILFRKYNLPADIFLDHNNDMSPLIPSTKQQQLSLSATERRRNKKRYSWEANNMLSVTPFNYDFRNVNRSPIVKLGYFVFSRDNNSQFFEGPHIGEVGLERSTFYSMWNKVKKDIDIPWIFLHSANENWGLLSTEFPNRTENWGKCCENELENVLNHNKTLLFLVNQHHNMTHPKLLSLPRGMPIYAERRALLLWDILRTWHDTVQKDTLVFTSSSSWKHRPYVSECIAKKFKSTEMQLNMVGSQGKRSISGIDYIKKMVSARTGIALGGLGYDTFRLWEYLTLGTVPVLEKGIGLDKTLWRLPALLVEDFDEVTPDLLRVAYVEALYRVNEFEFERLKQSFWFDFIMNVSASKSFATVLEKFPPQSEDPTFTRPIVPYPCGITNTCGVGTKRIPKSSCGGKPK